MSHIKVQYVREACHVVGVLFFPVSLTQSFMHPSPPLSPYSLQLKTNLPWLQSGVQASPPGTTLTPYPNMSIRWWMWVSYPARNSAFHFLIKWSAKAEPTPSRLSVCFSSAVLLPPAVHHEKLWPEPGWLYFAAGLWRNSCQLPFFLLHSQNWQVHKLKRTGASERGSEQWKWEIFGLQKSQVTNFGYRVSETFADQGRTNQSWGNHLLLHQGNVDMCQAGLQLQWRAQLSWNHV